MTPPPQLRRFAHRGPDWKAAVALRHRVLREPLGLTFAERDLAAESSVIHMGCFLGDELVGCLFVSRVDAMVAQVRQVAVKPALQRSGVGSRLMAFAEEEARREGFAQVMVHARQTAVAFYERLGYRLVGEPFTEVGIAHRRMEKSLDG